MNTIFILFFCIASGAVLGQSHKTENVIVVTLDGMRWQEVFGGVDSTIMNNPAYTHAQKEVSALLWNEDAVERRKKLFPFLWSTVVQQGQLYGNRNAGSNVNNANPYK